jgi:hypothetical protein
VHTEHCITFLHRHEQNQFIKNVKDLFLYFALKRQSHKKGSEIMIWDVSFGEGLPTVFQILIPPV